VRVEGLNLRLNRDKDGHGNWEDIGKLPQPAGATPPAVASQPASETPPAAEKPPQPIRLDIDSLTVNNARVEYNDEKTGKQFSAESIQLSTGAVHDSTNIPLKATAFLSTNQPMLRVRTELNGELRIERALQRYRFEDMKLSGELTGDPLQGKAMTFSAQGQVSLDKAANVAEWTGIKISANQLRALGELKANDLDKTPQITGGLSIAQFDLAKFVDSIGQTLPAMAAGSLSKVELVSRIAATPTSVAFDNINLKVDDSSFSGRIAVEDFAKQSLRAILKADTFNVDRYLPPKSEKSRQRHASTSGRSRQHRGRCHGRRRQHAAAGQADQNRVEHRSPVAGGTSGQARCGRRSDLRPTDPRQIADPERRTESHRPGRLADPDQSER
jgi:AsmA protein